MFSGLCPHRQGFILCQWKLTFLETPSRVKLSWPSALLFTIICARVGGAKIVLVLTCWVESEGGRRSPASSQHEWRFSSDLPDLLFNLMCFIFSLLFFTVLLTYRHRYYILKPLIGQRYFTVWVYRHLLVWWTHGFGVSQTAVKSLRNSVMEGWYPF